LIAIQRNKFGREAPALGRPFLLQDPIENFDAFSYLGSAYKVVGPCQCIFEEVTLCEDQPPPALNSPFSLSRVHLHFPFSEASNFSGTDTYFFFALHPYKDCQICLRTQSADPEFFPPLNNQYCSPCGMISISLLLLLQLLPFVLVFGKYRLGL